MIGRREEPKNGKNGNGNGHSNGNGNGNGNGGNGGGNGGGGNGARGELRLFNNSLNHLTLEYLERKVNQQNLKNILTYILMKIQKERYMDSDSKMNQQRDPVLQRLENQIDLMLTRFRQQSQWSSEHG